MMRARILIAEDNRINLVLVEYLLTTAGHETRAAGDGVEALRLARQWRPDLVLCDLQMPELDGYAVLRELRADPLLREVPVIALTAFSRESDRANVITAGFDAYLSKPIDPELFVVQIQKYLRPEPGAGAPPRP
jgi:CheY-like chemotaxis protein